MGLHARIWFTAAQKAELWERWKNGQRSAIRQEVLRTFGEDKKTSADGKASTVNPPDFIRRAIDSRKSSSSSMIEIRVSVGNSASCIFQE